MTRTLRRLAAGWAMLAALLTLCPSLALAQAGQPVIEIQQAQRCLVGGLSEQIPGPSCQWRDVKLPLAWSHGHAKPLVDTWFKFSIELQAVPPEGLALLASTVTRSGRVYANGSLVAAVGPMVEPMPISWNRPRLVAIPPALLHVGSNEIELQVRTHNWEKGLLGRVRLGPETVLRPLWEQRVRWETDAVEVVAAITFTIGLVMLGIWMLRRSESTYFWFGLACLAGMGAKLDFFVNYPPMPTRAWEYLVMSTPVLWTALICMFILRFCGRRMPRMEAAIWTYFAVGFIGMVTWGVGQVVMLWFVGCLLVVAPLVAILLVREGMKRNAVDGALLFLAVVIHSLFSWYDAWLYATEQLDLVFLSVYSSLLYVMAVGFSLIRAFVASLAGHERAHAVALQSLEAATQATKEKNLFFSMVSHELKSPLQSIITVLATEDARTGGRERREPMKKIGRAVKHMEAQIRDLFVLSVGDAARLEMRSETFEAGELVDEVVAAHADAAASKGLRIEVARPDDFLFVATDPKRVDQVLSNLLENAIKYTPAGSVTIAYALDDGPSLRISVEDTGVGIAREHLDKVFVPYQRFGLLDREHNSLGIGLAVVQTLLTHLGGSCEVRSAPGAGSTFTVRIPVAVEREVEADVAPRDAMRLLIVDDRPDMLADLRAVAEMQGCIVDTATSAPEASNQLAVSAFDVVLIDLDMPVKNGYELASEIRRGQGPNSETCLVAVSAGSLGLRGKSEGDGSWPFDAFEQKPVDARTMKRIVETRPRRDAAA